MEDLTDAHPASGECRACGLDIRDDQVQAVHRAGRRELHHAKVLASPVIDVEGEAGLVDVEGFSAIHVRDG
jgi:hypothetical protein